MTDETPTPEPQVPESEPVATPEPEPVPVAEPEPAPAAAQAEPSVPPGQPNYSAAPVYAGVSQDEKTYAMIAWFGTLFASFIPPLVIYLISNDKPFAKRHAGMCLGFAIAMTVLAIIGVILVAVLIGLLILPAVGILGLVVTIMGGIAASKGEPYDVPVIGPMIVKMFNL